MQKKSFLLLIVVLSLLTGCGTPKKIAKKIAGDIVGSERTLKIKIALLPTINDSGVGGSDLETKASLTLKGALAAHCENLIVEDSETILQAFAEIPRLPSGYFHNLALAEAGRIHGINALLEQTITDIEVVTEKRGIWGFREDRLILRAAIRVRIFDIQTTATYLDDLFREEMELPEELEGLWDEEQRSDDLYEKQQFSALLNAMVPRIQEHICERLEEMPWNGFIVHGAGGNYTLSAGSDVGLAVGNVLEVFEMGEPVQGLGGRFFLIAGPKIGEIEITKVQNSQAEATIVSGSDLEKSCCVRLKP